jgi:hypothetical protein
MPRGYLMGIAVLALSAGMVLDAQSPRSADVQMKAAQQKAEVEGDLKGAIEAYKKVVASAGANRALAAQALLRMAECYQKLGDVEARKVYERIAREFADQKDVAADASRRLAALSGQWSPDALTARLVWSANAIDASASITPDGRFLSFVDWDTGDIAIRDMPTGQIKRLMAKAGEWRESPEFGNFPVLSPDLRQVVYEWNDGSNPANYHLRVMANEVGGKPRVLTTEFRGPLPSAWSQDGKSILALVWKQDNTGQIVWVSAADGTVKVLKPLEWRLSGGIGAIGATVHSRPSLSPDGRYVAYTALTARIAARDPFTSLPRMAPAKPC